MPWTGNLAVSVWLPAGSEAVGVYVAEQVETSPDPVTSVHVGVLPGPDDEKVTIPLGLVLPDVAVTVAVHEVPVPA